MISTNRIFTYLLWAGLALSVVEIGFSAYFMSAWTVRVPVDYNPATGQYTYRNVTVAAPGSLGFLVFDCVWSLLVAGFQLAIPRYFPNASDKALGYTSLVLNTLTTIYWLSAWGVLASAYAGWYVSGVFGAVLAFAIVIWLVFLALAVISWLAAFGTIQTQRRGIQNLFKGNHNNTNTAMHTMRAGDPENPAVSQVHVVHETPKA